MALQASIALSAYADLMRLVKDAAAWGRGGKPAVKQRAFDKVAVEMA